MTRTATVTGIGAALVLLVYRILVDLGRRDPRPRSMGAEPMTPQTKQPLDARREAEALRELQRAGWPTTEWSRASEVVVDLLERLEGLERELSAQRQQPPRLPDGIERGVRAVAEEARLLRETSTNGRGCRLCGARWKSRTIGTERYLEHKATCSVPSLVGAMNVLGEAMKRAGHEMLS